MDVTAFPGLQDANDTLARVGISLDTAISAVQAAANDTATDSAENAVFIQLMQIIESLLQVSSFFNKTVSVLKICAQYQIFDALPEEGTPLAAKLYSFVNATASDSTVDGFSQFYDIYGDLLRERGTSVLWFYGAAVCTFSSVVYIFLIWRSRVQHCWV